MPIALTGPLAWKRADPDELKLLQSLQGNILKGHGRPFTANIFFKFDPTTPQKSRRALRELANFHVTSAHRQLLDTERHNATGEGGGAFVHVALSFRGYQAIGKAASAPADADFQGGMKAPASIAALADPAIANWEAAFQQDLHGVVLAANETAPATAKLAATLQEVLEAGGATIVHVQHGAALFNAAGNGIENFGYVDGRSQPLVLQEDIAAENEKEGASRFDPAAPLSLALIKDPGTTDAFSFGSLFVFRKLEQDVRAFKRREQLLADRLGLTDDDRELAGALVVGRFEDGTPVTLSNSARGLAPPNNFDYAGDQGSRCPLHAHIRKSNPRGSSLAVGGNASERPHLMLRRGIPYEDVKRAIHPDELPETKNLAEFDAEVAPKLPTGGVGLLFMAYNHKIDAQFKFVQQSWVNDPNFPPNPAGAHGMDPVIGQGALVSGQQKYQTTWDEPTSGSTAFDFSGFVKMRGGEYFFSPSLTFLRAL